MNKPRKLNESSSSFCIYFNLSQKLTQGKWANSKRAAEFLNADCLKKSEMSKIFLKIPMPTEGNLD